MDGTARCRYSGAPFCPLASPTKQPTLSAPAALHAVPPRPAGSTALREPSPHNQVRPP